MSGAVAANDFLFTQKADAALVETVRGIQGKHERFGTDFLTLGAAAVDAAEPMAERVEAWRNPKTGLWNLERFTRLPGDAFRQEPVTRDICFFDALHYCARFQTAAQDKGAQTVAVPGERWTDVAHYRAAAEAAGQAIDEDGEVHPCAHGQALTGGWFSGKALADAHRTKDETLALALPAPDLVGGMIGGLVASPPPPALDLKRMQTEAAEKKDLISQFQAVSALGEYLVKTLESAVKNEFKIRAFKPENLTSFCVTTIITAGVMPVYSYIKGWPGVAPDRSLKVAADNFRHAAAKLSDGREKSLALEFAKAVEFAYWMEKAAQVYQDCRDGRRKAEATAKGLPYIGKAGAAAGLTPLNVNRLRAEYGAGGIACGTFRDEIRRAWNCQKYSWGQSDGNPDQPGMKEALNQKIMAIQEYKGGGGRM